MKWLALLLIVIPSSAFASQTIGSIINTATSLIVFAVQIAAAAALLFFLWNMFQLITSLDDAEKKKQARPRMMWGILALFVLVSLGALIGVLEQTFFGTGSQLQQGPDSIGSAPPQPADGFLIPEPDTGDDGFYQDPFRPDESGCTLLDRVTGQCNEVIEA